MARMTDREIALFLLGALQAVQWVIDERYRRGIEQVLEVAYESRLFAGDEVWTEGGE